MTAVGFKSATIQPFAPDGTLLCPPIVVEGTKDKGATVSAEITGLSKDQTKTSGSNIGYYTSRKGTGDVSVDFGLLDLPEDASDIILGYYKPKKIAYIGDNTEAPYCSVLLESENMQGEKSMMGFFTGTFTREKISLNTLDVTKSFEPEADSYTFSASNATHAGDQKGQVIGKYVGTEEEELKALHDQVLNPDNKEVPEVTEKPDTPGSDANNTGSEAPADDSSAAAGGAE